MHSDDVTFHLQEKVTALRKSALALESDAKFYFWQENRFTIRCDEVCAAIQRLEWELQRLNNSKGSSSPIDVEAQSYDNEIATDQAVRIR